MNEWINTIKNIRWRAVVEVIWHQPLASAHICAHIQAHVDTQTHTKHKKAQRDIISYLLKYLIWKAVQKRKLHIRRQRTRHLASLRHHCQGCKWYIHHRKHCRGSPGDEGQNFFWSSSSTSEYAAPKTKKRLEWIFAYKVPSSKMEVANVSTDRLMAKQM